MPIPAARALPMCASRRFILVALLVSAVSFVAPAEAWDIEVGQYEHVELIKSGPNSVSFVAWGRQFDMQLEASALTTAGSAASLYRGELVGQPGSWVRLTQIGGHFSGAVWDGSQLWLLNRRERLAPSQTRTDGGYGNETVVYPISEIRGEFADRVVGDLEQSFRPEIAAASFGPQPGRILDIGLVASAEFVAKHGAQAEAVLLEMFNVVEGIFITQVGVQLRATEIVLLNTNPPGFDAEDPAELLDQFGLYKFSEPTLAPLGLAHLFVARQLDSSGSQVRLIGIANIGALCDARNGVGITETADDPIFEALIVP